MSSAPSRYRVSWDRIDSSSKRATSAVDVRQRAKSVDRRSKQRIHHQCFLVPKKQLVLHYDEEVTTTRIDDLLVKYMHKKQSTCKVYCLEDGMRFERIRASGLPPPLRDYVRYSDIKHCSRSSLFDKALIMYVVDSKTRKRTLELYECLDRAEAEHLGELIDQARREPECRLLSPESLIRPKSLMTPILKPSFDLSSNPTGSSQRRRYTNPEGSNVVELRQAKSFNPRADSTSGQFDYLKCKTPRSPDRAFFEYNRQSIVSNRVGSSVFYTNQTKSYQTIEPPVTFLTKIDEASSTDTNWRKNTIFVQSDPIHGTHISDTGSVFLYSMRIEEKR